MVSYTYDDFEDVSESKADGYGSFDNELQYTGAIYDDTTQLLYLNARYYEPRTGRFISRDTYRGERNNADTWHLYLYCANNPINYVDPSGHRKINANWVGFGIDIACTVVAGWMKIGYDIIGQGMKYYAKKKGFRLFYDKLLYEAVPKFRLYFGSFFTKIRKMFYRATGVLLSNAIPTGINTALKSMTSYLCDKSGAKRVKRMIHVASRLASFGSAIALLLDIISDKKMDEKITI